MPMILADFYTRKHQKRLEFLNKAEFQYHQYLKLMTHYHIVPKNLVTIHEKIRDSPTFETERDEKILLYRESKAVNEQMEIEKSKY